MERKDFQVTKATTLTIVTSGYDDRYLSSETELNLNYSVGVNEIEMSFREQRNLLDFLIEDCGFGFDEAWEIAEKNAVIQRYIVGKYSQNSWASIPLSGDDVQKISKYLRDLVANGRGHDITPEPIQGEKLAAIIAWQISECDRRNIESWGHKNGHQAAAALGSITSLHKAQTSAANGRKGGRPRKQTA